MMKQAVVVLFCALGKYTGCGNSLWKEWNLSIQRGTSIGEGMQPVFFPTLMDESSGSEKEFVAL